MLSPDACLVSFSSLFFFNIGCLSNSLLQQKKSEDASFLIFDILFPPSFVGKSNNLCAFEQT